MSQCWRYHRHGLLLVFLSILQNVTSFHIINRRAAIFASSSLISIIPSSPRITSSPSDRTINPILKSLVPVANALPFFEEKERRQLELCLVNVLRVQYWAINVADTLQNEESEESKRKAYLEARLGAKAMVADRKMKIGGGASLFVITLKGLQLKECLDDLKFYAKSKKMDQYKDEIVEALASLVEFDGLETTQDPSPRSSLTLAMYNSEKSIFVRRMLAERITPITDDIIDYFGKEKRAQCESYVEQLYPNEIPKTQRKTLETTVTAEE